MWAKHKLEVAQCKGDFEVRYATILELRCEVPAEGNSEGVILNEHIMSDDIARVVARVTSISVQYLYIWVI
jgi:hypothetical protein